MVFFGRLCSAIQCMCVALPVLLILYLYFYLGYGVLDKAGIQVPLKEKFDYLLDKYRSISTPEQHVIVCAPNEGFWADSDRDLCTDVQLEGGGEWSATYEVKGQGVALANFNDMKDITLSRGYKTRISITYDKDGNSHYNLVYDQCEDNILGVYIKNN